MTEACACTAASIGPSAVCRTRRWKFRLLCHGRPVERRDFRPLVSVEAVMTRDVLCQPFVVELRARSHGRHAPVSMAGEGRPPPTSFPLCTPQRCGWPAFEDVIKSENTNRDRSDKTKRTERAGYT